MGWDIGVDLGTRGVRMTTGGSFEALSQAAALAVREGQSEPVCAGDAAMALYGRASAGVEVCFPLADGTLRNSEHARQMFAWLYALSEERRRGRHARVLIACAPFARPVQQDALLRAALDAGATEAALLRSDAACALGAGLDLLAPEAALVVDVGAGKVTATLFTRGLVAAFAYLPYGVLRIDERLERMLRTEKGFRIGPRTAEDVKQAMASAGEVVPVEMTVAGVSLERRLPELIQVEPEMVARACEGVVGEIAGMVASVVDNAPEELAADLNDSGCVLTGGGALLPGLDKRLGDHLGIPCRVAAAPLSCAAAGLARVMQTPDAYDLLLMEKMARAARH
ncbi:MAG TPA: rod shape-determining protein [Candidatus Pullichristensenella avicola]|nr:rod shape-determining protein [Candidatus Pullichristensenella avicola]